MQEVQPRPGVLVIRDVYEQRRRPGPAKQVPGNDGALLMVASHAAIALLGGFASAFTTKCSHRAGTPQRETVMFTVRSTPRALALLIVIVVDEQCRRPETPRQVAGDVLAVFVIGSYSAIASPGGDALARCDQAIGIALSCGTTARADRLSRPHYDLIDGAMPRPFTVPGRTTTCDRRRIVVQGITAQRMPAETIPAQPIPAYCQFGEQISLRQLRTVRPTAMACAAHVSGQSAVGRPRRSSGRQRGYVTTTSAGASRARQVVQGFSLRYPRGN